MKQLRTWGATAAAVALVFSTPGIADAHEPDFGDLPPDVSIVGEQGQWTVFTGSIGYVYDTLITGDADSGDPFYGVIAGGTIADVCAGELPPEGVGLIRQKHDGTWITKAKVPLVRSTSVYELDDGESIFDFFGRACGGLANGVPLPDAFASGETHVRARVTSNTNPVWLTDSVPQAPGDWFNSVRGTVHDAEGNRYRLRASADFVITVDGGFEPHVFTLSLTPLGGH